MHNALLILSLPALVIMAATLAQPRPSDPLAAPEVVGERNGGYELSLPIGDQARIEQLANQLCTLHVNCFAPIYLEGRDRPLLIAYEIADASVPRLFWDCTRYARSPCYEVSDDGTIQAHGRFITP